MALYISRRLNRFAGMLDSLLHQRFSSRGSDFRDREIGNSGPRPYCDEPRKSNQLCEGKYLMDFFPISKKNASPSVHYSIEVVDAETWQISAGLSRAWHDNTVAKLNQQNFTEAIHESGGNEGNCIEGDEPDFDFDEIDNMRVSGNLFYKLDRASKEFKECNFDFHRKKSQRRKDDHSEVEEKNEAPIRKSCFKDETLVNMHKKSLKGEQSLRHWPDKLDDFDLVKEEGKKKLRVPTFNELTGPYHEPFCLDIFISNASVRACIVHRVTSNVVVVAHSISKDMKFDLTSTRNARGCEAVGEILAQRALADDIHDVVYTPRRGEVLEGKLGIVVDAIIRNGVRVKLKLKKRMQKGGKRFT